jgi:hypothetical protein
VGIAIASARISVYLYQLVLVGFDVVLYARWQGMLLAIIVVP